MADESEQPKRDPHLCAKCENWSVFGYHQFRVRRDHAPEAERWYFAKGGRGPRITTKGEGS